MELNNGTQARGVQARGVQTHGVQTRGVQIPLDNFTLRSYQIPLWKAFDSGKFRRFLIVWPRRCLSGNTHITMADGSWKYLKDIKLADRILSWNGSEFVSDIVVSHWKTGLKETKSIRSFGSLPLVSSYDHLFANSVHGSSIVKWTALKDLGKNRKLMQYAGKKGMDDDDLVTDFMVAEFLGLVMGDGYCSGDQQPKFTNKNLEVIERMKLLVSSIFNVQINKIKNEVEEFFRINEINIQKFSRRLPRLVWSFSDESIYKFFSGLIAADGNIYIHRTGFASEPRRRIVPPAVEVTISCGNSDLYGWDIYWLLRKVGIFPQVPYKERGCNWKIKIAKCLDLKKILALPIVGKNSKRLLALELIKNRYRQASPFKGCIRTSFSAEDSKDEELYDIEVESFGSFVANGYLVHNSGKEVCAINIVLYAALRRVGTYYIVYPTFSSGRRILWDAIDIAGHKMLSYYIPDALVESKNEQQMRIRLLNGSQIQIIGSDDVDKTLVGTNAVGIVYSEYALQDPRAWTFAIPILKASDGWALFVSTPRGKNNFYDLYKLAQESPDWFCQHLTIEDTKHIPIEEIEKDITTSQMSRDLALQEYWCSFDLGIEGSYYTKYIDNLRLNNQIVSVPWQPYIPVHTAWDLGYNDPTSIIFFQIIGTNINIIDCYENNKQGLEHYAKILHDKGYTYGKHIAPFDIAVHDLSTGISRWKMMHDLGVTFIRYTKKQPGIDDGIEAVRRNLPRMWFDESKCKPLLKALENYRQEFDPKRNVYRAYPLHNEHSHFADSMRYLCISLDNVISQSDMEALEERYNRAYYGEQSNLPAIFRDDLPNY